MSNKNSSLTELRSEKERGELKYMGCVCVCLYVYICVCVKGESLTAPWRHLTANSCRRVQGRGGQTAGDRKMTPPRSIFPIVFQVILFVENCFRSGSRSPPPSSISISLSDNTAWGAVSALKSVPRLVINRGIQNGKNIQISSALLCQCG